MRKVGFIGAYDKTDIIMYLAKMLTVSDKKVLVIDSTITQKAKYVIPVINPTVSYLTSFEQIDVAVGFRDMNSILDYLGRDEMEYDYVLIDVDSAECIESFSIDTAYKNYFVTAFDAYSIKKGLEILGGLQRALILNKVLFTKEILKEEDDYLNYLASGYKVIWEDYHIYFPLELGDQTAIAENQRIEKIRFKNLSTQYRDGLVFMTEQLAEDVSDAKIRKILKAMERGV